MQARKTTATTTNTRPVDDTDRLLFFWATLYFVSALVSLGVEPALRGAWVGLGPWIERLTPSAALLAQSAAIFSSVCMVQCVVVRGRNTPPLGVRLFMTLLALGVVLVLMAAQLTPLPGVGTLLAASLASLCWFSLALDKSSAGKRGAAWFWMWFLVLALKTLAVSDVARLVPAVSIVAPVALLAFGLLASIALGIAFVRSSKRPAWSAAGLVATSLLLAQAETAAGFRHAPRALLLIGRTMSELRGTPPSWFGSWHLGLTLSVALFFLARRSAPGALVSVLCLGLLLPWSPLGAAAFALGALALARE